MYNEGGETLLEESEARNLLIQCVLNFTASNILSMNAQLGEMGTHFAILRKPLWKFTTTFQKSGRACDLG